MREPSCDKADQARLIMVAGDFAGACIMSNTCEVYKTDPLLRRWQAMTPVAYDLDIDRKPGVLTSLKSARAVSVAMTKLA